MKKITLKVQEWRTAAKSQECDTRKISQEWIAITRARNQEVKEQLKKRLLRRPYQKHSGILRKGLVY